MYTKRNVAPTRPGKAASVNNWSVVKWNPALFNWAAMVDHRYHTQKDYTNYTAHFHKKFSCESYKKSSIIKIENVPKITTLLYKTKYNNVVMKNTLI